VAVESDLDIAKNLSRRLHNKVLLKREDQQPVFSFKLRGAYNKMANLTAEQLQKGDLRQRRQPRPGRAMSAKKLGCRAVIVMPTTTPQVKIDAVIAWAARWCWAATAIPTPTSTRQAAKAGPDLRPPL
jgi:threonine dehydratase